MRRGWESQAQNWASFARTAGADWAHDHINLPALRELLPPPGDRSLDLACGEGRLTRLLGSLAHRVAGADASPSMVALARAHPDAEPTVVADAGALPFRDGSFDFVLAYMCLHDIDDMPRAVAEAARVLAPAGRLLVAITHPLNTAGAFASREDDAPFVIAGSYFEPAPLTMVAERDGFSLTFHSEHRPLEAYARAAEQAGLLIEALREVAVPATVAAAERRGRRWQRVPLFLHLLMRKPGSPPMGR